MFNKETEETLYFLTAETGCMLVEEGAGLLIVGVDKFKVVYAYVVTKVQEKVGRFLCSYLFEKNMQKK